MFFKQLLFIFVIIFTAPLYAEVFRCDVDGIAYFSSTPCDQQEFDFEIGNKSSAEIDTLQKEEFITPTYPGWSNGWKKTKETKLTRFIEMEYEPINANKFEKSSYINKQKLSNIPSSMSVKRFAVSVEDIIDSICVNSYIYPGSTNLNIPNKVFYGHYACSIRRDTKLGELGHYKIMRGENSIYMIAVKWSVDPFQIKNNSPSTIIETNDNKRKSVIADRYLRNDVKLCKAEKCF